MSEVHFIEPALDRLLNTRTGEVGRYLNRLGVRIVAMAVRLTGFHTGRLSKSIKMSQTRVTGVGQELRVFSNLSYAYIVHEGTRPHEIVARGDRVLAFTVGGKHIYVKRVAHPGTRGKRYLTIPLRRVVGG